MAHSPLFSSQFSCMISINTMYSEAAWKTVQKLADLDIHCFLKRITLNSVA